MTITVYADSNIYRYMATGELEVITVGSVRFAYSSVHFDEIMRTGNMDILKGIQVLKAVLLVTNENGEYDIDSIGVCLEYTDPYKKFEDYKKNLIAPSDLESLLNEFLLRVLGADNLDELGKVPNMLLNLIDEEMIQYFGEQACDLQERIEQTSSDLKELIQGELSTRRPLAETRSEFGYPKGATSLHDGDEDPINQIWKKISLKFNGVTKEQFFGFEAVPGINIERGKRSRIGDVAACHLILNIIGFHPDKGLVNREKIKNIISDGQHLGYGSICGCFLTSDYRLFKKAKAIYKFREYSSQVVHIEYKAEGMSSILAEPGSVNRFKLEQ